MTVVIAVSITGRPVALPQDPDVVDEDDRVVHDDAGEADHADPGHDDPERHAEDQQPEQNTDRREEHRA
jgi:hypothetical protein